MEAAVGRVDEGEGVEVEFPGDIGVRAAVGQVDQGAAARQRPGAQHGGAVPHPGHALRRPEGVEVEQDLPLRGPGVRPRIGAGGGVGSGGAGAVGLPGGAPPQAARVVGVGPEVVEAAGGQGDAGDLVGGVEDLLDRPPHRLEALAAAVGAQGLGVAGLDPGQGLGALDLVEPGGDRRQAGAGPRSLRWRRVVGSGGVGAAPGSGGPGGGIGVGLGARAEGVGAHGSSGSHRGAGRRAPPRRRRDPRTRMVRGSVLRSQDRDG